MASEGNANAADQELIALSSSADIAAQTNDGLPMDPPPGDQPIVDLEVRKLCFAYVYLLGIKLTSAEVDLDETDSAVGDLSLP